MESVLSIGSGRKNEGDINLDIVKLPEVDIQGTMDSLPFDSNSFDVIILHHVLEHSENPIETLEECWRVCRPAGVIQITVPHGFSVRYVRDPTHSSAFTVRTIEHFKENSELPNWYSDIRFKILDARITATKANDFSNTPGWRTFRILLSTLFNKFLAQLANQDPELFEPVIALSSRADIYWEIQPEK